MHTSLLESVHGAITQRQKTCIYFKNNQKGSKANYTKRTDIVPIKHYFDSQFSLTEKYLKILDVDQIMCAEAASYFMRFQDKLLSIPSGKKN